MKIETTFFLLLLSSLVLANNSSCNNALWNRVVEGKKLLLEKPVKASGAGLCPKLGNEETCCDDSVYDSLEKLFGKGAAEMKKVRKAMKDTEPQFEEAKEIIENESRLTVEQKRLTLKLIDDMQVVLKEMVEAVVLCLRGILRYVAGMHCYACIPNWEDYAEQEAGLWRVKIHEDTCQNTFGDCEELVNVLVKFTDLITEYSATLTGQESVVPKGKEILCQGDCKNQICSVWIRGTGGGVPGSAVGTFPKQPKRSDAPEMEVWNEIYDSMIAPYVENIVTIHDKATRNLLQTQGNIYLKEGGYKAYQVGKDSGFDTDIAAAGNGNALTFSLITTLICVLLGNFAPLW